MNKYNPPFDPENERYLQDWAMSSDIEGTIAIPKPTNLTDEEQERLEDGSYQVNTLQHSIGNLDPVEEVVDLSGKEYIDLLMIDLEKLVKLIWEHRLYAESQGFADSEMEVLRVIEHSKNERVLAKEIKNHPAVEDYSESTVHKALNNLQEKGLVKKQGRGLYSYKGP